MKNIENYRAEKYLSPLYTQLEPDIYRGIDGVVTSLSFEQEPELGEEAEPGFVSQYPLEDVLDRFCVFVSDFYLNLNAAGAGRCYLEFCGDDVPSVRELRSVIGKHVYNKIVSDGKNEYAELVIE